MTSSRPHRFKGREFFVSILLPCSYFPEIQATCPSLNFLRPFPKEHPPRRTRKQTVKTPLPQNSLTPSPTTPERIFKGTLPLEPRGGNGVPRGPRGTFGVPRVPLAPAERKTLTQNTKHSIKPPATQNFHSSNHPPRRTPFPTSHHPQRGFSRGRFPLNQEGVRGCPEGAKGNVWRSPSPLSAQRSENPLTQNSKTFHQTTRNSEPSNPTTETPSLRTFTLTPLPH